MSVRNQYVTNKIYVVFIHIFHPSLLLHDSSIISPSQLLFLNVKRKNIEYVSARAWGKDKFLIFHLSETTNVNNTILGRFRVSQLVRP